MRRPASWRLSWRLASPPERSAPRCSSTWPVCAACRQEVGELSEVADELLLLAPLQEPPAGFESRVLDRIGARPARRRRTRRLALRLAAPLAAALATAAVLFVAFDDDRDLANRYRHTLAEANGEYFQAAPLKAPGGVRAGVAFGYQGDPSWVMVVVDRGHRGGHYAGELVTTSGRRVALRGFRLDPRTGSWGRAIAIDVHEVASVRLVDRERGETLEATLH